MLIDVLEGFDSFFFCVFCFVYIYIYIPIISLFISFKGVIWESYLKVP